MALSLARWFVIVLFTLAAGLGTVWAIMQVVEPAPAGRIVMATGGAAGTYHELAESFRQELERNGVSFELRQTSEGFATLRALLDKTSGLDAGFVKGGLVGSLQGRLASTRAREWHDRELGKLRSVGRMFHEPIWVFTRGSLPIESLRELEGRRILIGSRGSGARRVVRQLLKANGVDQENATFVDEDLPEDAAPIVTGDADAAILIIPADTDRIQKLLRVPNIRLMNFEPEAAAYTNRFPALSRVVLRRGGVEFDPLIPSADITLLATSAALVVRADLHPALVSLLTYAVVQNPRSGFDKAGDPVLFFRAGEFPSLNDPEFELARDSRHVYKTGDLPFLLGMLAPLNNRLRIPFSITAFGNAHGLQTILLLIPLLTILVPLMKLVPIVYTWSMRRRLLYWYRQLKALEKSLQGARTPGELAAQHAEIERIDAGVQRIRVPLAFSDQFYDLRGHIDLVRQRLGHRSPAVRMAAE
ncbi:MAG: ABC transporter substrate-binding protein [Hyphomicrobiaceae bacterium]|nr:ABC transporter substrate-binding protein [Hyphomicrobiaceae bacterium]